VRRHEPEPAAPPAVAPVAKGPVPWERRDELGLVGAFVAQLKETILEPTRFWATLRAEGSAGEPFMFAWLVIAIGSIGSIPYNAFNFYIQKNQFKNFPPGMMNDPSMKQFLSIFEWFSDHPLLASVGSAVMVILSFPIGFAITAGLVHLGAIMFGLRTKYDFATTVRVLGYASAASIFMVVPIVGGFAGIYVIVLEIWGLRELHEGTTGKAILARLWMVLLAFCCGMCGAIAAASMIASRVR
jgi:hypothetical protein